MEILTLMGLAAYCLVCLVVGTRLLLLARRTREVPELLMGTAFLSGGTVGYMLAAASAMLLATSPGWSRALYFLGMPLISVGSVCLYRFWQKLYHPNDAWAGWVVLSAAVVLAGALVAHWWTTDVQSIATDSPWYLLQLFVQSGAYAINVVANGRFYSALRRRLALGLADPVVTNRVFMWAFGSSITCIQYGYTLGITLITPDGQPAVAHPGIMSCFGMIGATAILLAFFPPEAYRRLIFQRAQAAAESA